MTNQSAMTSQASSDCSSGEPTFHKFLILPIELRLCIYEWAVDMEPEVPAPEPPLRAPRRSLPKYKHGFSSLPRVSHQVREESLAISYRRYRFPLLRHSICLRRDGNARRWSYRQVAPHMLTSSVPDDILPHLQIFQLDVNANGSTWSTYVASRLFIRRTRGKWKVEVARDWMPPSPPILFRLTVETLPENLVGWFRNISALMGQIQFVLDECPEGPITREWMEQLAEVAGAPAASIQ